jgi:hypothetical protein
LHFLFLSVSNDFVYPLKDVDIKLSKRQEQYQLLKPKYKLSMKEFIGVIITFFIFIFNNINAQNSDVSQYFDDGGVSDKNTLIKIGS